MAEEEKFLTAPEAAKLLEVSSQTLRRWGEKGLLTPHHVLPSGYRYYSERQIQDFLSKNGINATKQSSNKVKQKKSSKTKLLSSQTTKFVTPEKPLFKLYVDSGAGKTWVNYYAMRSGKTNAFVFANNLKNFNRDVETIDGQEIIFEDDEYRLEEPMHSVTITLDGKYIENVTTAIAKGVFWIQLVFTNRLGSNHPSDSVIEEARYMKWKIDDYMRFCGLNSRARAIEGIKKILTLLSHAEIQWQEEIIVRDDNGKPVYSGRYRDKDGNFFPKIKKEIHTYRGVFLSTRDVEPVNGAFDFWINREFAKYLAHAGVIAVHENFFKIDSQRNHHAITLAAKLFEYHGMNRGKKQAGVLSVKTLLNSMPSIPKYETLTHSQLVKQADGSMKVYEKHGDKGGWTKRILNPFENAFNALVDLGILRKWCYRYAKKPDNYDEFINQFITFEFNIQSALLETPTETVSLDIETVSEVQVPMVLD